MLTSRESEKEIVKSDIFYNIAEKNEDVISLHELSKKEYERNDEKMNNGQFNSNVMNNNLGGVTNQNIGTEQEPTFGGRFFPSLEDEPTNMNLNNMNRMSNEQVNSAILPNQAPNNLIDLTDVSGEKEPIMAGNLNNQIPSLSKDVPNLGMEFNQNTNNQPTMNQFNIPSAIEIPNLVSQPENNIPNNFSNMNPANSNQINIPVMNDNNMNLNMGVDYQNVTPVQNIPQFDMSQNIAPTQFGQAPEMSQAPSLDVIQNDFSGNINMPTQSIPQEIPNFNQDFNPSFNPGIPSEAPQTMDSSVMDMQQFPQKEVLPVINTLKNLASSLETFGYKINISEEDLPNSHKLTIEVEK